MTEPSLLDTELAIISLALTTSKKASAAVSRDLLLWAREQTADAQALLDQAGILPGGLNASLSDARKKVEDGIAIGIYPIPISSDLYPASLRSITDAPSTIFVRGNIDALKLVPGVAVVGTRKATAHGLTIAERIAEVIGKAGYTVVSGLALGIDAAAHEGALKSGTPTITVLAHGLEKAWPRTNAPLAARILDQGGLWVSEHPIGVPGKPEHFVLRNRIQVGLSAASIIVEGEERSGSMTQAEFCLRNKRALFAVLPRPGDAVATQHRLPKMLVTDRGAIPIRSRDDYPAMLDTVRQHQAALLEFL